jgi:phosphoglycerate dehydrogenase-like enzyme
MPYWNREESTKATFSGPVVRNARILALADPKDINNEPLYKGPLPDGAELLAVGTTLAQFDVEHLKAAEPNVIFVSYGDARQPLAELLQTFPSVQWVHTRSAGIDFCTSETLSSFAETGKIQVTNAKGCFSSTLAEYAMMACAYFAKDLPRLLSQKKVSNWEKYPILELRGATLGIIGYGDIGRATAKLGKAYGMKILALRRSQPNTSTDPYADKVLYGKDALNQIFMESDYVLCAAPLTAETHNMIGKTQFDKAKSGCVFINVGRGPIVDEAALVEALQDGRLKGAGLDVTAVEPLPTDSPLWKLDNVLLSPHNMDMTETFVSVLSSIVTDDVTQVKLFTALRLAAHPIWYNFLLLHCFVYTYIDERVYGIFRARKFTQIPLRTNASQSSESCGWLLDYTSVDRL